MDFKVKHRLVIISLISASFLVILGSYFIFFKPTLEVISSLRDDFKDKELRLEEVEKRSIEYEGDGDILLHLREKLAEIEAILPDEINLNNFLVELEELLGEEGVELEAFSPKDLIGGGDYNKQPIDLLLSGRYKSMILFLEGIEGMERSVGIDGLGIKDRSNGDVQLELSIYIYSLK